MHRSEDQIFNWICCHMKARDSNRGKQLQTARCLLARLVDCLSQITSERFWKSLVWFLVSVSWCRAPVQGSAVTVSQSPTLESEDFVLLTLILQEGKSLIRIAIQDLLVAKRWQNDLMQAKDFSSTADWLVHSVLSYTVPTSGGREPQAVTNWSLFFTGWAGHVTFTCYEQLPYPCHKQNDNMNNICTEKWVCEIPQQPLHPSPTQGKNIAWWSNDIDWTAIKSFQNKLNVWFYWL